jgi:tRNA A-37 threonylcarbamoyl transferase component Bud32
MEVMQPEAWPIRLFLFGGCCALFACLVGVLGLVLFFAERRRVRVAARGRDSEPTPRPAVGGGRRGRITAPGRCPECGTALPADAPEGLCPQCLLKGVIRSAHDAAQPVPAAPTVAYAGPAAPTVEELATLFPQLEIIELIGQGGMGAVYKARQPALDRLVAVKVLPPEAGRDPAFAERFGREARALARLGHPNIVAVHDVGRAGEFYYLVMEYVDGANLRQVLRDGKLTPEQALRIVPQICDALQYAHEEGVVHRDIKPENILLDKKGRVKIADFGLAKLLGRDTGDFTLTGSRQVMGTLYYMAPEQVERPLEVDHRADIYSLGVVFYEMLTGQLPVGRFPMPSEKAGTDAFLDEVVLRTLEREPDRRYQHASDVKTDVESHARPAHRESAERERRSLPASRVRGPAWALLVAGILHVLWPTLGAMWLLASGSLGFAAHGPDQRAFAAAGRPDVPEPLFAEDAQPRPRWEINFPSVLLAALSGGLGSLIIVGAINMLQLRSHGWALAAAALALVPCGPTWLVSFPAGIWALTALTAADMKAAFGRERPSSPP